MSKQRKFVKHLSHGGLSQSKLADNDPAHEDFFLQLKISCLNDPIDYEQYVAKNKTSIMNDPHRDLILLPSDDVKIMRISRTPSIAMSGEPSDDSIAALTKISALARHVKATCLSSTWCLMQEPLVRFRGAFCDLPKDPKVLEQMGKPTDQWYAIDHVAEEEEGSAFSAVRPTSGKVAELATNGGSGASRLWTSARRAAVQVARMERETSDAPSKSTYATKANAVLMEAEATVCDREEYLSYQQTHDAVSTDGTTEKPPVRVRSRHRFVLRQLTTGDLSRLRRCAPSSTTSLPLAPSSLPLGLHLIAPVDWGLWTSSGAPLNCRNVIFLDTIESVSGIGHHWLRLDRRRSSSTHRVAGDDFESFFTSSTTTNVNEVYLRFEDPAMRNTWIGAVKSALDAEQARLPSNCASSRGATDAWMSSVVNSGIVVDRRRALEQNSPDGDNLRSSLQRFSQENELFVSHQRQKNRLNLLSVCPDVQLGYRNTSSRECVRHRQQIADLLEAAENSTPEAPLNAQRGLPEVVRNEGRRHFLVTCLSLKTGLRASIEDAGGSWQIDNPEPFFVSFFLATTSGGGIRLSEDFCWNPNSSLIDTMLSPEVFRRVPWHTPDTATVFSAPLQGSNHLLGAKTPAPQPPLPLNPHGSVIPILSKLAKCRSALFSIDSTVRMNNLFIVFRVDKVLAGGISQTAEKYMKAAGGIRDAGNAPTSSDLKTGAALHKSMQSYCKLLGRYRMPFAWGARWLFSKETTVPLFKMDSSKVSESALLQSVRQLARLLTLSKETTSNEVTTAPCKTEVVLPQTQAVLETLEKSIKAEVLPIQLQAAVNEISSEIVSRRLNGLISSQLVASTQSSQRGSGSGAGADKSATINLLHVNDFSPDEVVKEVEVFATRKVRTITARQSHTVFDRVLTDGNINSGHNSARISSIFGDNKHSSLSIRSDASTTSSIASNSSAGAGVESNSYSRFLRFSSDGVAVESLSEPPTATAVAAAAATAEAEMLFSCPPLVLVDPYRSFVHTLYVYPRALNLAIKHIFGRARNLSCFMELRDSDAVDAKPLKVFYTRPSLLQPSFDTWFNTAVVHHDASPTFLDEAKVCLPIVLTRRHHLLFRFYHVRCDITSNSTEKNNSTRKPLESPTGFAWIPILDDDGSLVSGTISLPISQDLPRNYLSATTALPDAHRRLSSHQSSSMSNGFSFNTSTAVEVEPAWLDNKRSLFTVALEPVSTVYSLDPKLARFFAACASKLAVYTGSLDSATSGTGTRQCGSRPFASDDRSTTPSRPPLPVGSASRCDTTTGKLLCNAIKSLLLVETHALVQFFPALANQILEVLLVSSSMSQVESTTTDAIADFGHWLTMCQDMVAGGACDLAKTAVGTFSVILCVIKDVLSGSSTAFSSSASTASKSAQYLTARPALLRNFLEFSLDPYNLCTSTADTFKMPNFGSNALSLHQAVVRGMIAIMTDPSCPSEIAHRFLVNTWFFFEVVIKSLGQHLNSNSRYKLGRRGLDNLPTAFRTDLKVLIRLVGAWMVELCTEPDGTVIDGGAFDSGSTRSSQSTSMMAGGGVSFDVHTAETPEARSKAGETLGVELAESTATFLEQLLLLIDPGFVLQRLKDLLTFLEIRHKMSPTEVDRFNYLRYRLLQRFSETQYFVQINLPSFPPSVSDRREELILNERFCEQHFVVGIVLQHVACVLAGCADMGNIMSTRSLRQPLLLLLNQLAKLTFDPRYATSSRLRSRIHLLYLPLVKIALENINALGPPGLQMRELEKAGLGIDAMVAKDDSSSRGRRKSRKAHKLHKFHAHSHNDSQRPLSESKRKKWLGRTGSPTVVSDGSGGSLTTTQTSTPSNSSSDRKSTASSNATTYSTAFLGPNGKVMPEVLNQIAGFNRGGALRGAASRPRLPNETTMPKLKSGSTLTLTEGGNDSNDDDNENMEEGSEGSSSYTWYAKDGGSDIGEDDRGDLDRNADCDTDSDSNDYAWPQHVLRVSQTSSSEGNAVLSRSHQPPPLRSQESKVRPCSQGGLNPSSEAPPPPLSAPSSSSRRSIIQLIQMEYSFRPHIHRRRHIPLVYIHHLNDKCQRDLYICLLQLFTNLNGDSLAALFRSLSNTEKADFLKILTYAIQHLKYRGRKCISRFNTISTSSVTQRGTLGSSQTSAASESEYRVLLEANMVTEAGLIVLDVLNLISNTCRKDLESSMPSNPVFQGILDVYVCLLTTGQSEHLLKHTFASLRVFISRFAKVLFSETTEGLARVCLAGLRTSNLNLLPCVGEEEHQASTTPISSSSANIVTYSGTLSPLTSRRIFDQASAVHTDTLRLEACGLIYRMWRASFEVFGPKGFKRVHLQMIVSLSKLVGDIGPEFETSLSLLHGFAELDIQRGGNNLDVTHSRSMSQANSLQGPLRGPTAVTFMEGIEDLIKRIRTVLTATAEMRRYSNDPYRQIDLQYSLAKSYASNPVLRRTWLEKLAELHLGLKNMAEVAMAKIHIAALMAEYLHKRGEFPEGCDAFCKVSANIRLEEASHLCDPAIIELSYNQEDLLRDVADAATALEAAGLFEALQPVYALITPVYEARRDYLALAQIYHHLGRAYENTARAEASAHRLFASYFRVTFFGKAFESLAGKSYIYRAEAWQKLNVFLQNQIKIFEERLGVGRVEKLVENYVDPSRLSPDKAYIQVTFVEPYLPADAAIQQTTFDLHHNVRDFFFDTPFIMQPGMTTEACLLSAKPKRTDDLTAQWKRRTTLSTEAVFPHLRSRLEVVSSSDVDLSPLDAAIDAIQVKVQYLSSHIPCAPQETANLSALHLSVTATTSSACEISEGGFEVTTKGEHRVPLLLDMHLQGALLPTVNQGPMAYAHAFLAASRARLHPPEKIDRLKRLFFDFLTVCLVLLTRYRPLMMRVHPEKYTALRDAFDRYRVELSNLLNEEVVADEARLQVGPKSQFAEMSST